jgi:hypothetical protein
MVHEHPAATAIVLTAAERAELDGLPRFTKKRLKRRYADL